MKLHFIHAEDVWEGIQQVSEELGFEASQQDGMTVTVNKVDTACVKVFIDADGACITYGGGKARFFRSLSILCDALRNHRQGCIADEVPLFDSNGAMVDMSRNAVMRPETVKLMMRKMALMGMNTFMLYTEDTYEVKERPYFGYMRGRYTKDEIRDMDSYAQLFGIELIPCIQLLGHLATYLRWGEAAAYKDTENVLLVDAPETYVFIDDLLKSIAECFTSRRIHMGMDETHNLGTGRSLDKYGYQPREELYLRHLAKVAEMAKSYGFTPMLWSDMFFNLSGRNLKHYSDYDVRTVLMPGIEKKVPEGVECVFWDYYNPTEDFYRINLEKHDTLSPHTLFAGGVWCWSSHAVQYSRSIANTRPALEAMKKKGTKEVIATVWHNGSESSLVMSLAGLCFYAEFDYTGEWNERSIREGFRRTCFAEYDDMLLTEAVEFPYEVKTYGSAAYGSASRALLYNDPLNGLADWHVRDLDTAAYYSQLTEKLKEAQARSGMFAPAYAIITALSKLLIRKADFGVRLKKAYDAGDKDALSSLHSECDIIIDEIKELRSLHRSSWMVYNKPFGWEVHDIRYGGLIQRFDTAKARIDDYLAGRISAIEELEAERLPLIGTADADCPFPGGFVWMGYRSIATTGIL